MYTLARFWRFVQIADNGCWVWHGRRDVEGYGHFSIRRQRATLNFRAHRWLYQKLRGPIPTGLELDHLCRNTSCVRLGHPEVVTQRENQLRGRTITALNLAKTRCPRGHELDGWKGASRRYCRTCARDQAREYRRQRKLRGQHNASDLTRKARMAYLAEQPSESKVRAILEK